ncbi:hypothetical protein B0H10DRAFT_2240688 [Mycena sp. CBHHK59/15]|nr:hypothetical protein B0H10DRAFT_2240688 [Mycena sp. CBHHK59/15]
MWADYMENGADFSAGDNIEDPKARFEQLREEAKCFGLWNPDATARKLGFGDPAVVLEEDLEDDYLGEIMRDAGLLDPEPDEILENATTAPNVAARPRDSEWYPYPNKMMFLLDTLDNLPRLRVSSSLMRAILWVLKEARCKDVPSFDRLRKVQKDLCSECGIPSIPCKSVQGNVFFMNDPRTIIAQDWSNPATRKLIRVYPEIPEDGIIREFWHAQKWRKTMDLDILSPMYNAAGKHYYVNEVSRLQDGRFVIPVRWVTFRGKVYADAYAAELNDQGEGTIIDTKTTLICSDVLNENYYDLEHADAIPKWTASTKEAGYPDCMPNPKRKIAAGRPMYSSFVNYFSDDVSGNRTKSWNKHWNAYMTHENLPRELHQQEFHVHFVSTSPNASASEQFQEFKTVAEATHTDPVEFQDEDGTASCFCLYINAGASDNPMQSEVAAHIGGKATIFVASAVLGEHSKKRPQTKDIMLFLRHGGTPPTKEKILEELEKQTATGVKDVYTQFWIDDLISRSREMRKDKARSLDDIKKELIQWTVDNRDKIYSPFLTMKGFDPAKDTPIEILHTILLGVVKYVWHITHTAWSPEEKQIYAVHLQATNVDGLSIHAIRSAYIMQYAGSLIGRQFKTLVQTNIFHVQSLVSDLKFKAWKAVGELSALLWVPEIGNLVEYQKDLKVAVGNVLDICAMIDPSKMITKIKYHLLVHSPYDAALFGPLIGVATEIFESFNGVFRYCSILSNHLAPSQDIALQLGDQEGFKHRITGGQWSSGEDREWKLVGWTEKKLVKHGEVKLVTLKRGQTKRESILLKSTSAASALNFGDYKPASTWTKCLHVISESLDECFVNSWVFAKGLTDDAPKIIGRVSDILIDSAGVVLVVLDRFQVLGQRDALYGMPVLVRRDGEVTSSIVPAKLIMFKFNVQHDCKSAECEATGVRLRMQERVQSDKTENFIVHKSLERFIINTHAFHNAHLLRATLPRDLVAPIPLVADRRVKHHELAAELREQRATKKRKRAQEDGDEEVSRKRRKVSKKTVGRKRKPANVTTNESLASGRSKRQIKPTEKAAATPEPESEGEQEEEAQDDSESDSDMDYDDSDAQTRARSVRGGRVGHRLLYGAGSPHPAPSTGATLAHGALLAPGRICHYRRCSEVTALVQRMQLLPAHGHALRVHLAQEPTGASSFDFVRRRERSGRR